MGDSSASWFFSRMMALVLFGAVVALVVLFSVFDYITPSTRTQVFFLQTEPEENQVISIEPFSPNDINIEKFAKEFVQDYVFNRESFDAGSGKFRNMIDKWGLNGPIKAFSSDKVYHDFVMGDIYKMGVSPFNNISRKISILQINSLSADGKKWRLKVMAVDNDVLKKQQIGSTTYEIDIGLEFNPVKEIKKGEFQGNALGLHINSYEYLMMNWEQRG